MNNKGGDLKRLWDKAASLALNISSTLTPTLLSIDVENQVQDQHRYHELFYFLCCCEAKKIHHAYPCRKSWLRHCLMPMFHDLFSGHLQLIKLNFGTITLLPKKEEAVHIEQFRPICLLNVSFKIFTKVGTNRVTQIAHSVVQPTQTAAFIPG